MTKKQWIIHPVIFIIYPVVYLYGHNIEQMAFRDILAPSSIFLAGGLFLWGLLSVFIKSPQKAALLVSFWAVLFFSYGHVHTTLMTLESLASLADHKLLFSAAGILAVLGTWTICRLRDGLAETTRFLNLTSLFLFAFLITPIIKDALARTDIVHKEAAQTKEWGGGGDPTGKAQISERPNIYYIILDGYAHQKILKENYGYDNSGFVRFLQDNGFYIVRNAKSNYAHTQMSLASSLNMKHLYYLEDILGRHSKDVKTIIEIQENNEVTRYLKSRGYKFVHFSRGFGAGNRNQYSDLEVQCGTFPVFFGGSEFVMHLIQTSMLLPFERFLIGDDMRERVLCTFEELKKLNRLEFPFFSFSHVLPPHPPYIFGPSGEAVEGGDLKLINVKGWAPQQYLDQVTFVSREIEKVITKILEEEKIRPIIIIQSDHGAAFEGPWEAPTDDFLVDRLSILNAILVPEKCRGDLYEHLTPVNTFRTIFNCYFGSDFEPLEDRSFFSRSWDPYEFIEVTHRIPFAGAGLPSTLSTDTLERLRAMAEGKLKDSEYGATLE